MALNILLSSHVKRQYHATSYNNCHFFVTKLPDVSLLVKNMTNNFIFDKKLGYTGI